jgi:hypothetical protein
MFTCTSIAAIVTAERARTAAATASALRFWLPLVSSSCARSTTASPSRAISSGVSIVRSRASSTPSPVRSAARKALNAIASCSISASA